MEELENNKNVYELSYADIGYKEKPVYDFFKRVIDMIIAVLFFTVGLPFLLMIAAAIVIDDFGNPVFVQERVGLNGTVFKMYKFRTMRVGSDKLKAELESRNECDAVHFKMENDPRVTRVGKFLRKTSLDESLQCLNLLFGNMTLIGPRPFVPDEQKDLPYNRLAVKPGLSCYWQITYTDKLPMEEQMALDYKYIRERSFRTDIKIIIKTIGFVFKGKNV